jgi:hypothetical protein
MVGFPLYRNQALAFCCLTLTFWQSPCLAQSISETTSQRDAPSNLKPASEATSGLVPTNNSFVPGSIAVDQFALVAPFWTSDRLEACFGCKKTPRSIATFEFAVVILVVRLRKRRLKCRICLLSQRGCCMNPQDYGSRWVSML